MKLFLSSVFLFSQVLIMAQTDCPCCTEYHSEFDFWVGNWTVKDTLGNEVGKNSISKREGECIVFEEWKGAKGSTGTSMNYFDRSDSTWNQLWVDNQGNPLKLKGGLEEGKMVLKSELKPGKKVDFYYNQVTWTPNDDGTVIQLWEVYEKEGKLLTTVFLGIYHREE